MGKGIANGRLRDGTGFMLRLTASVG